MPYDLVYLMLVRISDNRLHTTGLIGTGSAAKTTGMQHMNVSVPLEASVRFLISHSGFL
jgi:hypothetical protein